MNTTILYLALLTLFGIACHAAGIEPNAASAASKTQFVVFVWKRLLIVLFSLIGAHGSAGSTVNRGINAARGEFQPKRDYNVYL